MKRFTLDYVAPDGGRLPDILDRELADIGEARSAALRVLREFKEEGATTPGALGHIEILDERKHCVAEVHFPWR